jgi:microsomal dipeptidase-like Zn-dependent dipeptidase
MQFGEVTYQFNGSFKNKRQSSDYDEELEAWTRYRQTNYFHSTSRVDRSFQIFKENRREAKQNIATSFEGVDSLKIKYPSGLWHLIRNLEKQRKQQWEKYRVRSNIV